MFLLIFSAFNCVIIISASVQHFGVVGFKMLYNQIGLDCEQLLPQRCDGVAPSVLALASYHWLTLLTLSAYYIN